jgi:hypothetical protein
MNKLYWVANYSNGEKLTQFSPEGLERKYADINREILTRFDLINQETKKAVYSLYLREGQQLIFRRRTLIPLSGGPRVTIYLVGYQMTIMALSGALNLVVINYIHEDGSIALDGARNNLELLDFEH